MDGIERALREQTRELWATVVCFLLGTAAGAAVLWGAARPFTGEGSLILPVAIIAGAIAGGAFVVSTRMHRRGETRPMPGWQVLVSDLSAIAVTIALAGVTGLGVLLAGEILAAGLQGLHLPAIGAGVLTGAASAVGGRLAFHSGIDLGTRDLAGLLSLFLVIGTLFAMITAVDPTWWERNFSQLGSGERAWAFNGTMVVAGLLVATVGSYVGRDLHRLLGDGALRRIAIPVIAWAAAGVALAAVGLLPIHRLPGPHGIAAIATLVLVIVAAVTTVFALPGAPRMLRIATIVLVALVAVAVVLSDPLGLYSTTVLEGIVIGLVLLWMSTLVRVLGILAPARSRPSTRRSPLRA